MNGGELLVECLARNGVTVIFGVPGGQAAPLYAALEGDARVEYVMMRDERNCAYAADAYARVSGRCAVVDATVGPGVTKLPSGLGEAYNSSIPIVALVTNVPTDEQYLADRGQVLQGLDQLAMLRPVVKQVYRVPRLDALPRVLNRAIQVAVSGRPGPTVVEIPQDVLGADADPSALLAPVGAAFPRIRFSPAQGDLERAAALLAGAERPLILAGGGAVISAASDEVARLAERLDAAVATTFSGKGVFAESHELALGVVGSTGVAPARKVCERADVVLLVGFKFGQNSTWNWRFPKPGQTVIHLDIDPEQVGGPGVAMGLVGDARLGLGALADAVGAKTSGDRPDRSSWRAEIAACREAWDTARRQEETAESTPILPQRVLAAVAAAAGPSDVVVCDASFASGWGALHVPIRAAGQRVLFPRGLAGLGYALPAAVGAALGAPGARVWCVAGDGAMCYSLGEFATLAARGTRVVTVVLNNRAYGWIRWWQTIAFGKGVAVSKLGEVDFAAMAAGAGVHGVRVSRPKDLEPALREAGGRDVPCVIDVATDADQTPIEGYRRAMRKRESAGAAIAYGGGEQGRPS